MPVKRFCMVAASLCFVAVALCAVAPGAERGETHLSTDGFKARFGLNRWWVYTPGDDAAWANASFDDSAWQPVFDPNLSSGLPPNWADLGWFRLHLVIAPDLVGRELPFYFQHPGASEVYLDGELFGQYGLIGATAAEDKAPDPKTESSRIVFSTAGEHVLAVRYALRGPLAAQALSKNVSPGFSCWLEYKEPPIVQVSGPRAGIVFAGLLFGIGLVNFALFAVDMRRRAQGALSGFAIAASVYVLAFVLTENGDGSTIAQAVRIVAIGLATAFFVAFCFAEFRITRLAQIPGEIWFATVGWIGVHLIILVLPFISVSTAVSSIVDVLAYLAVCFVLVRSYKHALDNYSEGAAYALSVTTAAALAPVLVFAMQFLPEYEGALAVVSGLLVFVCAAIPTVHELSAMSHEIYELELQVHEVKTLAGTSSASKAQRPAAGVSRERRT